MKKKALIIIPIIIVVAFIIILIPKSSNNIEETTAETSVPEPTATATPNPIPTVEPTPTPIPSPTPDNEASAETLDDLESENGVVVNSTSDNVILSEDEYKGDDPADPANASTSDEEVDEIVDGALEQLMKEHPDWFSEEGSSGTTNKSSDYVHVDGPVDNGELTNPGSFGQSHSDVAPGTVY